MSRLSPVTLLLWLPVVGVALCALLLFYVSDSSSGEVAPPSAPSSFPDGFREEVVASDLTLPTVAAFLPDGRILIAEKSGVVRMVKGGVVLGTPWIDLQDEVNDYYERGLLGLAVDPDFAQNGYVYLAYTYENDPADFDGSKTGRVVRYTTEGDTARPDSEEVLLGTLVGESCNEFPPGSDCIPNDWSSHSVGALKFAPDGTLFVSLGEAAPWEFPDDRAFRSQDLDTLAGKLLRVSPLGDGLPTNPFWNGDPEAARSKVWAYGVRNVFRFNLRPGSGVPYVGDVGWSVAEEVSVAPAGANLGWPCFEAHLPVAAYQDNPICQELLAQQPENLQPPLVTWRHGTYGASSTGGDFYTGSIYPPEYQGAYFYGDYVHGTMRYLHVGADDELTDGPSDFGPAPTVVDIEMGPDGALYYIDLVAGELRRIVYSG